MDRDEELVRGALIKALRDAVNCLTHATAYFGGLGDHERMARSRTMMENCLSMAERQERDLAELRAGGD